MVGDHHLVHPVGAGILQVGLERRKRSELPSFHHARLDQELRPVANGRHRLARGEEGLHKFYRSGLLPQRIGIGDTARQEQAVVIVRIRLLQGSDRP